METANHWRTAFFVMAGVAALLGAESVTIKEEVSIRESAYNRFVSSKLKNGKTIGQMIRPGSASVFELDGRSVICAEAR